MVSVQVPYRLITGFRTDWSLVTGFRTDWPPDSVRILVYLHGPPSPQRATDELGITLRGGQISFYRAFFFLGANDFILKHMNQGHS